MVFKLDPLHESRVFPHSWAGEWAGSPWNSDPETPVLLFPLSVKESRDEDLLHVSRDSAAQRILCCAAWFSKKLCWKGNHKTVNNLMLV